MGQLISYTPIQNKKFFFKKKKKKERKKWDRKEWYFQRQHVLDPDAVSVLKHQTLWTKLHIQTNGFKWRTHKCSIIWPVCLQLTHGKSVLIHLLVHHGTGIKEGWVLALCDVEQSQSLFWASVISSFLVPMIWSYLHPFNALRFLCSPGPPRISVLLKAVFSCLLTQRIHDDCGCHRNDSSIIKVAACDHKYSKES